MSEDKNNNSESTAESSNRDASSLPNPARIYAVPAKARYLDPTQLAKLEQSFRSWAQASSRPDVYSSRKRILLIFLLIRYTGARLSEVLGLDLQRDVDGLKHVVRFGNIDTNAATGREVQVPSALMSEIQAAMEDAAFTESVGLLLNVDAGHVRRKFYERSVACGFSQELGSPNAIRRARAVELMQGNMPLPVVQRVLGHSTPNLTASFVAFSDEDIHQVAKHFVERENTRKSSARNTFFGKIGAVKKGDIQSQLELVTIEGEIVTTVITNYSLKRLGLKPGSLVTAEVKAPWVILEKGPVRPSSTAENIFHGVVAQIVRGRLTTEFIVRIHDGMELCSLVTEKSRRKLNIKEGDEVWVMFNSFAVILHVD
jgi:molybdate transport system regulatory protein